MIRFAGIMRDFLFCRDRLSHVMSDCYHKLISMCDMQPCGSSDTETIENGTQSYK